MDAFRQWAVCVIIAAAAGTFVTAISPRGSMDKTVRAVVGIFIVATICAPLSQLKSTDISEYAFSVSDYPDNGKAEDNMYEHMISVCKKTVEDETLLLADEYKIKVESIKSEMNIDENNCIIIRDIQIDIQYDSQNKTSEFSEKLSEILGVSVAVNER